MHTELKLNKQARESLKAGVDMVANAVKVSLGAEGRNVVIPSPHREGYTITKDGVSIAKSIWPEDKFEGMGASLVKEAAHRTNVEAGDGTTTATVLAQAIFNEGLKFLEMGFSAVDIKRGIDACVNALVEDLDLRKDPVAGFDDLQNIATISANGDAELGKYIAQAFSKIGEHGQVITEESDTSKTHIDLKDGVVLEQGWTSPLWKTDTIRDKCVIDKPLVLLHRGKIEKNDPIVDLFEQVYSHEEGKLLIITDDIDPFVHSVISQNVVKGNLRGKICVVKMPQILKIHKELLTDLSVLCGATVVSQELGTRLSLENLGRIEKVVCTEKETIIVGDQGNLVEVIAEIEEKISITDNAHEKKELQERLARITGGVATLYVGAKSDTELKEKLDRVEDSINATRSALEEGVVAGGGVALMNIARRYSHRSYWKWYYKYKWLRPTHFSAFYVGHKIVLDACYAPARQICANAERPWNPSKLGDGYGMNVKNGTIVNMVESGIIDPKKVTRCALENAASVAGLFLTTEGAVARFT